MNLETERLLIRSFLPGDLPDIHRLLYADAEVADWWTGYSRGFDDVRERFLHANVWRSDNGFGFRAVTRKDTSDLVGLMGFQMYEANEDASYIAFQGLSDRVGGDPARIEVELTYALGRSYWGHGYAAEASAALIPLGFNELGIWRFVNAVSAANLHSVNLMRRLGFRIEPNRRAGRDGPSVIGVLDRTMAFGSDVGASDDDVEPENPMDYGVDRSEHVF